MIRRLRRLHLAAVLIIAGVVLPLVLLALLLRP